MGKERRKKKSENVGGQTRFYSGRVGLEIRGLPKLMPAAFAVSAGRQ